MPVCYFVLFDVQTGGFVTRWGANFTFVTIKHAGHMVPAFEPEAAITFYSAFLKHQLPQ